jgi:putative Holliday junction resolvase
MAVIASAFDLPTGRILALDLGRARHGVAVCDQTGTLATPVAALRRHSTRAADFAEVQALVKREQAVGVLVGLPLHGREGVGAQARWVLRYGGRMSSVLSVPVAFWDESLSSHDVAALVRRHAGESLDAAAAALILQDFLEARRLHQRSGDA